MEWDIAEMNRRRRGKPGNRHSNKCEIREARHNIMRENVIMEAPRTISPASKSPENKPH